MKTILVSISDREFEQFGIQSENLSFAELLDIVSAELSKQMMNESSILAEKFGLSIIEIDEFTE